VIDVGAELVGAIANQSTAGAILMAECMVMALAIFAWVFLRWAPGRRAPGSPRPRL
jgi:hypothetical protein